MLAARILPARQAPGRASAGRPGVPGSSSSSHPHERWDDAGRMPEGRSAIGVSPRGWAARLGFEAPCHPLRAIPTSGGRRSALLPGGNTRPYAAEGAGRGGRGGQHLPKNTGGLLPRRWGPVPNWSVARGHRVPSPRAVSVRWPCRRCSRASPDHPHQGGPVSRSRSATASGSVHPHPGGPGRRRPGRDVITAGASPRGWAGRVRVDRRGHRVEDIPTRGGGRWSGWAEQART